VTNPKQAGGARPQNPGRRPFPQTLFMPTRILKLILSNCADCPFNLPAPPSWRHRCFIEFNRGRVIRRRPRSFPPCCPLPSRDPDSAHHKN
jgi:hypothetical protein